MPLKRKDLYFFLAIGIVLAAVFWQIWVYREAQANALYAKGIQQFREQKDQWLRSDSLSPLSGVPSFKRLAYFRLRPDMRFELEFHAEEAGPTVWLNASHGPRMAYRRVGYVVSPFSGEEKPLYIYSPASSTLAGNYLLPFSDSTNGISTYAGGRYLDIAPISQGRLTLDFNLAYHPYCAYNPGYSCPLPPPENRIQRAVKAGEKLVF